MSDAQSPARLPKLPFYLADAVLSAIALFVLYRLGTFEGPYEMAIVSGCLLIAAIGAWLSILPWLREYDAQLQLADSANLASALEQIQNVESVADQIRHANSQWQGVQDAASRTAASAQEIADRMKAETEDFMKFLQNAHDQERSNLRLEVEKLRRSEGDWIKVVVQMLDHVFALARAAGRSQQPAVLAQFEQFQNACRDAARRIGLTPFIPQVGEKFDPRGHQLPDPKFQPGEDAKIAEVLASGYLYQGQLLRRALVLLGSSAIAPAQETVAPEQAAEHAGSAPAEEAVMEERLLGTEESELAADESIEQSPKEPAGLQPASEMGQKHSPEQLPLV